MEGVREGRNFAPAALGTCLEAKLSITMKIIYMDVFLPLSLSLWKD